MNSIRLIKRIDAFIGPILLKVLPGTCKADPLTDPPKEILVIRPGGMGDALLLLPVLKEITSLVGVKIDILCEPRNRSVFESTSFINCIFSYQSPLSMVAVFKKKYDAVFDTEQSHFLSAIIGRMVQAKIRAGFKTCGREKMYNLTASYSHTTYEADAFRTLFKTVYKIGNSPQFDFPYFSPKKFEKNLPLGDKKIICLFPGATIAERRWPEQRWAKVIDWIADKNETPVLIGGAAEYDQCKKIADYCNTDKTINLCGTLSIIETAELFKRVKLLISTDSGILHLGVLCNIPTISLFGSGIEEKWAPRGIKHIIINKKLACSPCTKFGTTPPCKRGKACMLQISPKDVVNSIEKIC